MAKNYFDFLYGANQKEEKVSQDQAIESASKKVSDENIGEWTHKFVIYCKNPTKEFEKELKSKEGVVAVFAKEKESRSAMQ